MTLEELLKFMSHPDRLVVFDRDANVLVCTEDKSEMDKYVGENGDLMVVNFEVDFDPSVLRVELE